jgi:hypothetical protein
MGGACSTNGAERNACRTLVGKPEGKRPFGRPRRRWADNIEMNLRDGNLRIPCCWLTIRFLSM